MGRCLECRQGKRAFTPLNALLLLEPLFLDIWGIAKLFMSWQLLPVSQPWDSLEQLSRARHSLGHRGMGLSSLTACPCQAQRNLHRACVGFAKALAMETFVEAESKPRNNSCTSEWAVADLPWGYGSHPSSSICFCLQCWVTALKPNSHHRLFGSSLLCCVYSDFLPLPK